MVHAQPRATKDLDILIRCDAENARAVWRALAEFGAPMGDVTEDYFAQAGNGFRMGRPPIMIEILTRIDGVEFAAARARRHRRYQRGGLAGADYLRRRSYHQQTRCRAIARPR